MTLFGRSFVVALLLGGTAGAFVKSDETKTIAATHDSAVVDGAKATTKAEPVPAAKPQAPVAPPAAAAEKPAAAVEKAPVIPATSSPAQKLVAAAPAAPPSTVVEGKTASPAAVAVKPVAAIPVAAVAATTLTATKAAAAVVTPAAAPTQAAVVLAPTSLAQAVIDIAKKALAPAKADAPQTNAETAKDCKVTSAALTAVQTELSTDVPAAAAWAWGITSSIRTLLEKAGAVTDIKLAVVLGLLAVFCVTRSCGSTRSSPKAALARADDPLDYLFASKKLDMQSKVQKQAGFAEGLDL